MEGYLYKLGDGLFANSWNRRYFRLRNSKLSYFLDEKDAKPKRVIELKNAVVQWTGYCRGRNHSFVIIPYEGRDSKKPIHVSTDSENTTQEWMHRVIMEKVDRGPVVPTVESEDEKKSTTSQETFFDVDNFVSFSTSDFVPDNGVFVKRKQREEVLSFREEVVRHLPAFSLIQFFIIILDFHFVARYITTLFYLLSTYQKYLEFIKFKEKEFLKSTVEFKIFDEIAGDIRDLAYVFQLLHFRRLFIPDLILSVGHEGEFTDIYKNSSIRYSSQVVMSEDYVCVREKSLGRTPEICKSIYLFQRNNTVQIFLHIQGTNEDFAFLEQISRNIHEMTSLVYRRFHESKEVSLLKETMYSDLISLENPMTLLPFVQQESRFRFTNFWESINPKNYLLQLGELDPLHSAVFTCFLGEDLANLLYLIGDLDEEFEKFQISSILHLLSFVSVIQLFTLKPTRKGVKLRYLDFEVYFETDNNRVLSYQLRNFSDSNLGVLEGSISMQIQEKGNLSFQGSQKLIFEDKIIIFQFPNKFVAGQSEFFIKDGEFQFSGNFDRGEDFHGICSDSFRKTRISGNLEREIFIGATKVWQRHCLFSYPVYFSNLVHQNLPEARYAAIVNKRRGLISRQDVERIPRLVD